MSRKGRPPSTLSGMDFTSLLEGMVSFLFVDAGEKEPGTLGLLCESMASYTDERGNISVMPVGLLMH